MFPDFKELLLSFHAHRVKYLIVGGYAVSFHAQPRVTSWPRWAGSMIKGYRFAGALALCSRAPALTPRSPRDWL